MTQEMMKKIIAEQRVDDTKWLAEFLNHCPVIDPYDDEAYLVEALMPYVVFIRAAVEKIITK